MTRVNAERLRELRAKAVAEGRCQQCRARPAKPRCVTCQHCLDARKDRKKRNVSSGLCKCGRAPAEGTLACASCTEIASKRDQRRRARNIADGVCTTARSHGPVTPGTVVCEACRVRALGYSATNYRQRVDLGLCAYIGCKRNATSALWCPEHHEKTKAYHREYYARKRDKKRAEVTP